MSTLPEQFSAARQSQVEAQLKLFQTYASTAVENAEKIIALNLSTTRASMEQSSNAVRQLLAAQDPRDLLALTAQGQQNFENMLAYGRELFSIASGSQAALLKQAAPVIAPPHEQAAKAPKAAPAAAPEAKVESKPKPVAKPVVAETKPVAKPVVAETKPVAKPVVAETKPVAKPVVAEAKPVEPKPVAKTAVAELKSAEPKQLDMLIPKAKAKKTAK